MARNLKYWQGYEVKIVMCIEMFIDLITDALDLVKKEYYKVPTAYEPMGNVRERVFCYELYHQMRCLQESRKLPQVRIHGEIDKRGHKLFDQDEQKNPDFIFHVPGSMEGNYVVVEVKGNIDGNYRGGIYKDIKTLSMFTNSNPLYKLGILLIYNYSLSTFKRKMLEYNNNQEMCTDTYSFDNIIVICKEREDTATEQEKLRNILK